MDIFIRQDEMKETGIKMKVVWLVVDLGMFIFRYQKEYLNLSTYHDMKIDLIEKNEKEIR